MKKQIQLYLLLIATWLLTGCSVTDDDYVYERSSARNLPEIPEVASVRRPPPVSQPRYTPPPVIKKKKPYKPKVHKYSPSKTTDTVITQKEVAMVETDAETKAETEAETKKKWEEKIKQESVVDTDPYENIPDDSSNTTKPKVTTATEANSAPLSSSASVRVKPTAPAKPPVESSSAVKTLLLKARADITLGRPTAAISKLERGLRMEPRNPLLWYQLARANYSKKKYTQAISMAKKSIQNTNRDYIIAKNWMLIKKAGLKSGDTVVVKEAIDYFKINP